MQTTTNDRPQGTFWDAPSDQHPIIVEDADEPAELLVCRLGAAVGNVARLVLEQEGHLPVKGTCRAAGIQAGIKEVCRVATQLGQFYDQAPSVVQGGMDPRQVPLWRLVEGDVEGLSRIDMEPVLRLPAHTVASTDGEPDDWDGYVDEERASSIAQALEAIGSADRRPPSRTLLPCLHDSIDLSTAQGRWELLALSVLYGAPVKEDVAERAFLALRSAGLLELSELSSGRKGNGEAILRCLRETYFARTSKEQKADALCANAQLLHSRWGGDLMQLYCEADGETQLVISHLMEFRHVRKRAPWIAMMMSRSGLWSCAPDEISFIEPGARTALAKLALTRKRPVREGELTDRECNHVIQQYFGGDASALAHLGRTSCRRESLAVCTPCQLRFLCGVWR